MFKRILAAIKAQFVKSASPPKPTGPKLEKKNSVGTFEAPNSGRLDILENPKSHVEEKVDTDVKGKADDEYLKWGSIYDKDK